ncbi:MAG: ATP-dependent DNA helicase RecG [Desulfuromonadales bacterium]|nr:ATP-dependent DNA helicase RecG [Desulfuromonadales bacterium]
MADIKLNKDGSLTIPRDTLCELGIADSVSIYLASDGMGGAKISPVPISIPDATAKVNTLNTEVGKKNLQTEIRFIKGVGPKLAENFNKLGVKNVEDALYFLPNRYEDRREIKKIGDLRPGVTEVFEGVVISTVISATKGGRKNFEAIVGDETGTVILKWFNYNPAWMKKAWAVGRRGVFTGEIKQFGYHREIHHPDVDWIALDVTIQDIIDSDPATYGRIVPVYPLTEGINQKVLRRIMKEVVDNFSESVKTCISREILERHHIINLSEALSEVHFPSNKENLLSLNQRNTAAHKSLVFDEFFFLELGLALKRRGITMEEGISFEVTHKYTRPLLKLLTFNLTNAQRRVLSEIKEDMMSPFPMHRLVQGDVGSGKTLVALLSALIAVENDYQVAIMAPTEILAEQHFLNINNWCNRLGIKVVLLTASQKGKVRETLLEQIKTGEVNIVIGTHSVIQEKVEFYRFGMGIVDEQHRFGVLQRGILRKKGQNPDILVMTATPIPRTLAMTLFGDLTLSVIDELPPGRTPVVTKKFFESRRNQVYELLSNEIRKGRQAYIIYPLVEESEKSELKAATQMAEKLQNEIFNEFKVGLIHGRMKPEEKEQVMSAFKAGEIDILVSTTVIEVGIDVPNATVMVIEHAERFGLSQLHQLRGRVGRGEHMSYCMLIASDKVSEEGQKRLHVMESTNDGFKIAEADLEIRGPGDFLGTRQSGLPDFRVANILKDGRILEEARREAFALVERDPELKLPEHREIAAELNRRWEGRLELASIA